MGPKLVYVVIPHYWDNLMGDPVVFSSVDKARAYAKAADQDIQYTIKAKYIDFPKKKKLKPRNDDEWEEQY